MGFLVVLLLFTLLFLLTNLEKNSSRVAAMKSFHSDLHKVTLSAPIRGLLIHTSTLPFLTTNGTFFTMRRNLGRSRKSEINSFFAAHFAHVKHPRERESCVHEATSFSPDADNKEQNYRALFHCAHSAARQLSELYCKHCAALFCSVLATMHLSTFLVMHAP